MTLPKTTLKTANSSGLKGRICVPGDKSISHRALMFAALAVGKSHISGLLEGEDVLSTAKAMAQLGARVERTGPGTWEVDGVGVGGLRAPDTHIDMGNSGTAVRLLTGLLGTHDLTVTFVGDASLSSRPMNRIFRPLEEFGAHVLAAEGGRLPFTLTGSRHPVPVTYKLPVASAQVKSAVLLAGLNTPGETTVIEKQPTRDHTEIMLRNFGASVEVREIDGAHHITLKGPADLTATSVAVPGDPSSAAFPIAAAILTPGSHIVVENVLMNPTRIGLFETLREMGANLTYENQRQAGGEKVADIHAHYSQLNGVMVPPGRVASMIDEFPILSVLASVAKGETRFTGAEDLRVKESDRIAAMATGLAANGVNVSELEDGMVINGSGGAKLGASNSSGVKGGALVETFLDHRIAMSFLILGLASDEPVTIDDGAPINTSFPGFVDLLKNLGATIS
jgi:3-phosphoshikimate 1-carboxyvinyltransferase